MDPKKSIGGSSSFNVMEAKSNHIGGVKVDFPCKPYPTQLQLMSKVST